MNERNGNGERFGGGAYGGSYYSPYTGGGIQYIGPQASENGVVAAARPGARERSLRRGPKGYRRSDERIEDDIAARLWNDRFIDSSDVAMRVRDGVVTLEGTVPERWMKHAIEDIAVHCRGTREVENRIRVHV